MSGCNSRFRSATTRPITSRRSSAARTASEHRPHHGALLPVSERGKAAPRRGALSGAARAQDGGLAFVFPEFTVTAGAETQAVNQAAVEAVKAEMDRIVGLREVKDYVLSLEQNYVIQRLRESRGMKAEVPAMHMIFTGNPGTGKTTIARLVSRYLKAMGVLTGGQLVEVTRADLVGKYVGHTAPLTQQVIRSGGRRRTVHRRGVRALPRRRRQLRPRGDRHDRQGHGGQPPEPDRDSRRLLEGDGGISHVEFRPEIALSNIIEFPDYTAEELLRIARITVENKGYALDAACDAPLTAYFAARQAADARARPATGAWRATSWRTRSSASPAASRPATFPP